MKSLFFLLLSCAVAFGQGAVISGNSFATGNAAFGSATAAGGGGGGGGGLAVVNQNGVKVNNSSGTTAWVTNTIASVTSGNVLVLAMAMETAAQSTTISVISDNRGLTWSNRCHSPINAAAGQAEIWTAVANFSGAIWITNTFGLASGATRLGRSEYVWEVSGQEATLGGAAVNVSETAAQPLANITTTRAGSLVFGAISDFAAKAPPVTLRTGVLDMDHDNTPSVYRADYYHVVCTTATLYATGETAPTGQGDGICAYEIRTP